MTKTQLHAKLKAAINAVDAIHQSALYIDTVSYPEIATAIESLRIAEQKLETEADEELAIQLTEYRDGCLISTN